MNRAYKSFKRAFYQFESLSQKESGLDKMSGKIYTALGLMSGTSLDGIDAAIIQTDGQNILSFGDAITSEFSVGNRKQIAKATKAALKWKFQGVPPRILSAAEAVIDQRHIEIAQRIMARQVELIGYHGQTVLHMPPNMDQKGQTLQIGKGQTLANELRAACVYDFRTADIEAGGQGAPLAPIYHKALCDYSKLTGNTVVLNLGGVGNFTWVGDGPLLASDTGPANGPLDSWLNQHGLDYDPDGKYSAAGDIDFALIDQWLGADFFQKPIPKSADRYDFDVISEVYGMSLNDGAATLAAFCALAVKHTLEQLPDKPDQIIVCGGGRKNKTIMNMLRAEMGCPVKTAEDVGWRGDFIEAEAFAYLAVRSKLGLPISFPETTGVPRPMTGGRLAIPQ